MATPPCPTVGMDRRRSTARKSWSPLAPKIGRCRSVDALGSNTVVAVEDRQGHPDATLRVRLRMDDPVDRSTWHFSPRREYAYVPPRDDHAQETGEKASE